MKTALLAISTVSAILLLAACEPETKPRKPAPTAPPETGLSPTPSPTPEATATPEPSASPTPADATPTPTPVGTTGNIPYGVPVPGKPGFVVSPYSPSSGYVDVRGFAPNSEVKDPYSGKTFLVP